MIAPGSADIHTVGFIQYALDRLGIKSPRALCGASLAVPPGSDPAPLRDCPVCQVLASRRVRLPYRAWCLLHRVSIRRARSGARTEAMEWNRSLIAARDGSQGTGSAA